jgi:hypothetical protein
LAPLNEYRTALEYVATRDLADKAVEACGFARGRLFGYLGAWREFCGEAGVDPEAVTRASWGGVPTWISEPAFFPEVDELIEPGPEAKATALDLFRYRWSVSIRIQR